MRRHDIPEQNLVGEAELGQDPVHDRRGRLGGPGSRQLALGREREPGNTGTSVSRRLADEQQRRVGARVEVGGQPVPARRSALSVPVEVVRPPDPGRREPVDERAHLHPYSDRRRPAAARDRTRRRRLPGRRGDHPRPRAVRLPPRRRDGAGRDRRDPARRRSWRQDPVRLQRGSRACRSRSLLRRRPTRR